MTHIYERDIPIAMRDGVTLRADVWRPTEGPAPTLLVRTAYDKSGTLLGGGPNSTVASLIGFVNAGYAVVWQDVRGTYASEGEFTPKVNEIEDGHDTTAWIVEQDWSDGSIGTYGPSYLGMTQWSLATTGAPGVRAIAPTVASANWYSGLWYSQGGALCLSLVTYWNALMYAAEEQRELHRGSKDDATRLMQLGGALMGNPLLMNEATPVADLPLHGKGRWFDDWLAHPDFDEYWQSQDLSTRMAEVTVPVLATTGWYDLKVHEQVADFVRLRQDGGSALARDESRLIIGPWDHQNATGEYPDRYFGGVPAAADISPAHIQFFDHFLRDQPPAEPAARVRIFVMGIDEWRDEDDWPLTDTRYTDHYLTSGGSANTRDGDGALSLEAPSQEGRDSYRYDPRDPVPTAGGALLPSAPGFIGPVDQVAVDHRHDVLCYTGPVLTEQVEVTGFVELKVFVSSSAVDTDITAKLVDVFPDGRAINLCDGLLRLRYRDGLSEPTMMTPGEVYEVTVQMSVTSNVFLPGHRIRLDVSSSNFPHYDRNSNTGGVISSEAVEDMVAADTDIHHGGTRLSRLVLPIIDR